MFVIDKFNFSIKGLTFTPAVQTVKTVSVSLFLPLCSETIPFGFTSKTFVCVWISTCVFFRAFLAERELKTKHFEELGEAVSLGTKNAAVLVGEKAFGGALARDARFALYTSRLPTWHHRLKVGASWFFEGSTPKSLQPLGIS